MRRVLVLMIPLALLAACGSSASKADEVASLASLFAQGPPYTAQQYVSAAQRYIEGVTIEQLYGQSFFGTECATPVATTAGTVYDCLAKGMNDQKIHRFTVAINPDLSFAVSGGGLA